MADADIDDAAAQRTACSRFFEVRKVGGGGVEYDEYFQAGMKAQAGLSLPLGGLPFSAGASHERTRVVRVKYRLTDKWIAHLADPVGYKACCAQAEDNCSRRIIGEYLGGTGEILSVDTRATEAGASYAGVGAEVRDGLVWRKGRKFPEPVFFAFKISAASMEADWESGRPPKSAKGQYFVGLSEVAQSERAARAGALANARRQVIDYLGRRARDAGSQQVPGLASLAAQASAPATAEAAGLVVAPYVKDEDWRVERGDGGYSVKVLAFVDRGRLAEASERAAATAGGLGLRIDPGPSGRLCDGDRSQLRVDAPGPGTVYVFDVFGGQAMSLPARIADGPQQVVIGPLDVAALPEGQAEAFQAVFVPRGASPGWLGALPASQCRASAKQRARLDAREVPAGAMLGRAAFVVSREPPCDAARGADAATLQAMLAAVPPCE